MGRIRHSKAIDALAAQGGEQLDGYRDLALSPEARLSDLVAYCVERGVSVSVSMAHRDREAYRDDSRDVELEVEKIRVRSQAARQFVEAMDADPDGVAKTEAGVSRMWHELMFDFMAQGPEIGPDDLTRWANLGKALASNKAAEILRYRAEVERRARQVAAEAKQLATESTGDMRERLTQLADAMLSVGK
jgi:hypothetical protein